MQIRGFRSADEKALRALLQREALPHQDLERHQLDHFLVAVDDGGRQMGVIGCEPLGPSALLRSLAVDPEFRGLGVAAALVTELEEAN